MFSTVIVSPFIDPLQAERWMTFVSHGRKIKSHAPETSDVSGEPEPSLMDWKRSRGPKIFQQAF